MSIQTVIESLTKLLRIHEELLDVSKQKTEIIKEGSAEKLQKIVITEYKHIQQLDQAEIKRQQAVKKWFIVNGQEIEDMTIKQMLTIMSTKEDKVKLGEITLQLTEAITKLKRQEQLNNDLLRQSLQFVQVSLNAMNPTLHNKNYENKQQRTQSPRLEHSVFDSKA